LKITVVQNDPDIGKRLDLFLSLKLPQLSRSHIKKTIESNQVNLNGELCYKAGYKVRSLDVIDFPDTDLQPAPHVTSLPKSKFDLEIIQEDEDYLFINKPVGLIVHPTNVQQKDTLVNKLLDLNENLPQNHMLRPGIVHRLDKDTSGVIVIAKSARGLWWLSQQFADRKVTKNYVSIGVNFDKNFRYKKGDEFLFEGFMRRSSKDRKQFAIENLNAASKPQGRFSKSKFTILDVVKYDQSTNIIYSKIYLMTGRTHQIRVHQKELGFTIMKDPIYMSSKQQQWAEEFLRENSIKPRLFLHAHSISFESYDGKLYSVTAPVPSEFTSLLRKIEHL
jgi:23S rRNA pseudouridine1911/1915/1917 synthase